MPIRLGEGRALVARSPHNKIERYVQLVRERQALEAAIKADLGIAEHETNIARFRQRELNAYKQLTGGELGAARRILAMAIASTP